jgi:hypothetical protein
MLGSRLRDKPRRETNLLTDLTPWTLCGRNSVSNPKKGLKVPPVPRSVLNFNGGLLGWNYCAFASTPAASSAESPCRL